MNKKIIELKKVGVRLPRRVVNRKIKDEIIPWMEREEIIVISGSRQTGKSVLLYQLIYDYLLPKKDNIHYFNLDIPGHIKFFDNFDNIINLAVKYRKKSYLFIDEIQRLKEPGLFLKGLYDLHLPLKIVVSGSSALEIKSKISEALTGRKVIFHINPFNPEELSEALFPGKNFSEVIKDDKYFKRVLEHYLIYGGYPAVAMAKGNKLKLQILKEIFVSYLEKDVKVLLKIENINAFRNLIKILSSQIGNLLSKEELSNTLGIHKNTLDNYLFYLENTFILNFIRPFHRNCRKELLKSPKVYFNDLGIRNFAIGSFGDFMFRPDKGSLFENFAYLCLREKIDDSVPIYFWRTKAGAEVDFIVVPGINPLPLEVKSVNLNKFNIGKSLISFIHTYKPKKVYYLNLSLGGERVVEKTTVKFLTPSDFILLKHL